MASEIKYTFLTKIMAEKLKYLFNKAWLFNCKCLI